MFTVPGWAVSASSLVLEKASSSSTSAIPSSGSPTSASKKRKRSHAPSARVSRLSGSELERLWDRHHGVKQVASSVAQKPPAHKAEARNSSQGNRLEGHAGKKRKHDRDEEAPSHLDRQTGHARATRLEQGRPTSKDQPQVGAIAIGENKARTTKKNGRNETQSIPPSQPSTVRLLEKLPPAAPQPTKLTPLQAKMRSKLTSARFRHLNETLYTTSSSSALDLFTASPDLFAEYHAGFSQQVKESWPQNPVDQYVKSIRARGALSAPSDKTVPLPRRKTGSCTVADLGCGDAPLARGCQSCIKSLKLQFHNFDLHAPNSQVTKADIANLPLRDGEADIAVFCLSLMGTNWITFVEEAWRILRGDGKGEVWVAEVKSRFGRVSRASGGPKIVENSVGKRRKNQKPKKFASAGEDDEDGLPSETLLAEDSTADSRDETDISAFAKVFARRGFQLREGSVDKSNKMFVSMIFVKSGIPTAGKHKGLKWNGHEYQRQQHEGKTRFVGGQGRGNVEDEISPEDEAKTLKPCVYKTR